MNRRNDVLTTTFEAFFITSCVFFLPTNESLPLAHVRFIKDENICQELLFAKTLETDNKEKSIFDVLEHHFLRKKNSTEKYLVCCRWCYGNGWTLQPVELIIEKNYPKCSRRAPCK
jgi:hypothetical protein